MIELRVLLVLHLAYVFAAAAIFARVQHGNELDHALIPVARVGCGICIVIGLGIIVEGGIIVRLVVRYRAGLPESPPVLALFAACIVVLSIAVAMYTYRRIDRRND